MRRTIKLMTEVKDVKEKYSRYRDRKTQCCQDVTSSQLDVWMQCSPTQNPSQLFCEY